MGGAPRQSEIERLLAAAPAMPPGLTEESILRAAGGERRRRGLRRRATFLGGDEGEMPILGETTLLGR